MRDAPRLDGAGFLTACSHRFDHGDRHVPTSFCCAPIARLGVNGGYHAQQHACISDRHSIRSDADGRGRNAVISFECG